MNVLETLLSSDEPSVRFKAETRLADKPPSKARLKTLQNDIAASDRVKALLSERGKDGKIARSPYSKWAGAHWVLADLADLGYPPGDSSLIPLREQVYDWLFGEDHKKRFLKIEGKWRRCASQEGNAIYYLNTLGLADERTEELVERLKEMQWPDGGWNCRRDLDAEHSSFMETITPLRGHIAHAKANPRSSAKDRIEEAADIFLKRHLYLRQSNGKVMKPLFIKLHHPVYWRYDILFGLKVLDEAGLINDPRCVQALDLLESKQIESGGFVAEASFHQCTQDRKPNYTAMSWGGTGKKRMNEFVTVEALSVLKAVGRF